MDFPSGVWSLTGYRSSTDGVVGFGNLDVLFVLPLLPVLLSEFCFANCLVLVRVWRIGCAGLLNSWSFSKAATFAFIGLCTSGLWSKEWNFRWIVGRAGNTGQWRTYLNSSFCFLVFLGSCIGSSSSELSSVKILLSDAFDLPVLLMMLGARPFSLFEFLCKTYVADGTRLFKGCCIRN